MDTNLIREGIVTACYPERCACRVIFEDRDNLVSSELAILQPAGAKNKFYSMVDVGDSVVCLMIPNDANGGGYVIGSRYDEKNLPPAQIQDVAMIRFEDGTTISYNRASHELDINCVGKIKIKGTRIDLNE